MGKGSEIVLPQAGLAEDILGTFLEKAQDEADKSARDVSASAGERTLLHLVTFRLGGEEYGVEIRSVQEIIRATDIRAVPGSPAHVEGVINLRGKIIPVINLRKRFGLPEVERGDEQRIVVVELGEKKLGMLVDTVSQVTKIPSDVVEAIPEEAVTIDHNYIRGVGKVEGQLIVILDLDQSLLVMR